MELTKEDVLYTAKLAHLNIKDEEIETLKEKLSNILAYGDSLSEIDTQDVEPMYQVFDTKNVLREDEAGETISVDSLMENAPEHDERTVVVPKMIG